MSSLSVATATIAIGVLFGCGKNSSTPKKGITFRMYPTELAGTTLVYGDQRALITEGSSSSLTSAFVIVPKLPADAPTGVQIEIDTPCGKKSIPATTKVENRFPDRMEVMLSVQPDLIPTQVQVWIDAERGTPVSFGQRAVEAPRGVLHAAACADVHDVKISDRSIGKLEGKSTHSVFVASSPGVCYRFANLAYGDVGASSETIWRDAQVFRFIGDVTFFLQPAPTSVGVDVKSKGVGFTQIEKIPCP